MTRVVRPRVYIGDQGLPDAARCLGRDGVSALRPELEGPGRGQPSRLPSAPRFLCRPASRCSLEPRARLFLAPRRANMRHGS